MRVFKGKLVGICQSWNDESQLINMTTGKIIVSGTHEQILALYDKINAMDTIPDTNTILTMRPQC